MADLVPENSQTCDESPDITQTKSMLDSLMNLVASKVQMSLFRADLAFAAYRHLGAMRISTTSTISSTDLAISYIITID